MSWSFVAGPLLTLLAADILLALAPTRWNIRGSEFLLFIPVVYAALHGGLGSGLVSAALGVGFALLLFSRPGQPPVFTGEGLWHILTLATAMSATAVTAALLTARARGRTTVEATKDAGERYRDLVDDLEGVVWEADVSQDPIRFTFVSRRAETLFGYAPALWLEQPAFWPSRLHPEDRERVLAFMREAARSDTRHQIDYRAVTAAGRIVRLRDFMRGSQGGMRPGTVRGVMLDFTEQVLIEQELKTSEARQRAILRGALDCIVTMDHTGCIVDFNPAAEGVFGYRRDEVLGRGLAETIVPPKLRGAHHASLAQYFETGEAKVIGRRVEMAALRADGSEFPVELTITRIPDVEPPLFTGFIRDTTEQRRAEQELRGTLSLLAATLESTADGLLVVDLAGRIVSMNRRFSALWGIPQSILQSRDDDQALSFVLGQLKNPEAFIARVRELYARPESESFDVLEFGDGRVFERYSQPQWIEGRVVGRVWSFRDVTERCRTEAALRESEVQLRQSQKLDAIGRLAGGIAHDFNNLLTVILGYAELMLGRPSSPDTLRNAAEQIRIAAERAAALTGQLLAFGRKQILEPRELDLNGVVSATSDMLKRLIGEDISLEVELTPDLGSVHADEGQIQQVILNLAINSRDAMARGGRLRIITANVDIDDAHARRHPPLLAGPHVMLTVSDTGSGMDTETRAKIFEPFFTTKERGRGTGLGLATVYGIIQQTGGAIEVDSSPGQGTTFKLYLPRLESARRPAPGGARTPAVLTGTETVLLVEDQDVVRGLMSRTLEGLGYRVLHAGKGAEALETARAHDGPLHLLVTDVVMPEMSGPDLAERLASLRPGMRVLFVSGYADDGMLRRGVSEGAAGYLQKPFTPEALARKVRETLDPHQRV